MYSIANGLPLDNLSLTLTWTVKDLNKFHKLESNFPYWEVGFVKYKGKKKEIKFEITKSLKDISKIIGEEQVSIWETNQSDDWDIFP